MNPYALGVSALAMFIVGMVWFSSLLFGKSWMRHTGIRATDIRAGERRRNFIVGILLALATAWLLGAMAQQLGHSLHIFCGVVFIWLFIMLGQVNGFLWQREPFALFLLKTSGRLVQLLAGAAVFYLWK
ncbi:MAG: DUF1761 family protein [Alphaproteobacteria bacterium]